MGCFIFLVSLCIGLVASAQTQPDSFFEGVDYVKLSSSGGSVIFENELAFDSKIKGVRNAKNGEVLRLTYFIFSDDMTSSFFANELILAAKRGVKVKVLADLMTNYSRLDFFSFLARSSNNIEIRFYGKPPQEALKILGPFAKAPGKNPLGSLFFAGLFSQSAELMKMAIDLATKFNSINAPQATLTAPAQIQGALLPLLPLLGGLGTDGQNSHLAILAGLAQKDIQKLLHLTDYSHQKLLLIGERWLQMGGRNIEIPYHLNKNDKTYTFSDTDVALNLTSGGKEIAASFDKTFKHSELTMDLEEVYQLAPNGLALEASEVVKQCGSSSSFSSLGSCLNKIENMKSRQSRVDLLREPFYKLVETFKKLPKNSLNQAYEGLSTIRLQALSPENLAYIENLHYSSRDPKTQRILGLNSVSPGGVPEDLGKNLKNIQNLWRAQLDRVCKEKPNNQRVVYFNNAYFILPSVILDSLGKLTKKECGKLKVVFLTNSSRTTDLAVINIFAQYQMKAIYEHTRKNSDNVDIEIWEYQTQAPAKQDVVSLHSKVALFGDELVIGSANTDVRSFVMDSNNALWIRDPQAARSYRQILNQLIKSDRVKKVVDADLDFDVSKQAAMDVTSLGASLNSLGLASPNFGGPNFSTHVVRAFTEFVKSIYSETLSILQQDANLQKLRAYDERLKLL